MLSESGGMAAGDGRALRRFLIVDSHEPVRRSVCRLIGLRRDWGVCGEADCAADAVRLAHEKRPHVILVDPSFGNADGCDLTQKLADVAPGIRIVGYSLQDDCGSVSRFLAAGGHAFASKSEPPEALVDAIEQALAGRIRVAYRDDLLSEDLRTESQPSA